MLFLLEKVMNVKIEEPAKKNVSSIDVTDDDLPF